MHLDRTMLCFIKPSMSRQNIGSLPSRLRPPHQFGVPRCPQWPAAAPPRRFPDERYIYIYIYICGKRARMFCLQALFYGSRHRAEAGYSSLEEARVGRARDRAGRKGMIMSSEPIGFAGECCTWLSMRGPRASMWCSSSRSRRSYRCTLQSGGSSGDTQPSRFK